MSEPDDEIDPGCMQCGAPIGDFHACPGVPGDEPVKPMRAGPYIRSRIEWHKGMAAHQFALARRLQAQADEAHAAGAAQMAEAARWAKGTDAECTCPMHGCDPCPACVNGTAMT